MILRDHLCIFSLEKRFFDYTVLVASTHTYRTTLSIQCPVNLSQSLALSLTGFQRGIWYLARTFPTFVFIWLGTFQQATFSYPVFGADFCPWSAIYDAFEGRSASVAWTCVCARVCVCERAELWRLFQGHTAHSAWTSKNSTTTTKKQQRHSDHKAGEQNKKIK